jgi:hypothetical protein
MKMNKEVRICDICGKEVTVAPSPIMALVNGAKCTLCLDLCNDCIERVKKEYPDKPVLLKYDPFTETYSFAADKKNSKPAPKAVLIAVAHGKEIPVKEIEDFKVPEDKELSAAEKEVLEFAARMKANHNLDIEITVDNGAPSKDWENASIPELLEAIQGEDFETPAGYLSNFIPWAVLYARLSTKQKQMDLPTGAEFEFNGKKAKVVEFDADKHKTCIASNCVSCKTLQKFKALPYCQASQRDDGKKVMFIPVGE